MANTEFIDFSYGGQKASDFHLYRVSDGSRYNDNLIPTLTDKTAEIPGADGMYFFNTYYKQRQFSINFAYDSLTETDLRNVRNWLNGKEVKSLIFDEKPDRQYYAKVTGAPSFKYIAFDEPDITYSPSNVDLITNLCLVNDITSVYEQLQNGTYQCHGYINSDEFNNIVITKGTTTTALFHIDNNPGYIAQWIHNVLEDNSPEISIFGEFDRDIIGAFINLTPLPNPTHVVYKGEGSVQFTCYDPFAYALTPTEQVLTVGTGYQPATVTVGGTAPTSFKVESSYGLSSGNTIEIRDDTNAVLYAITLKEATDATDALFEWNSATGMVKARVNGIIRPIKFSGKAMGVLEPDTIPRITTVNVGAGTALNLSFKDRYI